jgi:D-tyrosyl-tRNA(Tyr) deacylase
MRALIQRVSKAEVIIKGVSKSRIDNGVLIFLGINNEDTEDDIKYIADKILNLRIFEGTTKKMDLSLLDVKGEVLIVSQFTLYGNTKKGRRPDFTEAADPKTARKLYNNFVDYFKLTKLKVETGEFAAMMKVELVNDGPVTFMIESNK